MEYMDQKETTIVRPPESLMFGNRFKGRAILVDSNEKLVFSFDGDWTDAQIYHALMFVNVKYDEIMRLGELRATDKIKAALGIDA